MDFSNLSPSEQFAYEWQYGMLGGFKATLAETIRGSTEHLSARTRISERSRGREILSYDSGMVGGSAEESRFLNFGMTNERLTQAIDDNTAALAAIEQRLQVIDGTMSEIHTEFSWLVRNNPLLVANTRPSETVPESIACTECDIDSPESLSAALAQGWTELAKDDGLGWNYLGLCPGCLAKEIEEGRKLNAKPGQKSLFK